MKLALRQAYHKTTQLGKQLFIFPVYFTASQNAYAKKRETLIRLYKRVCKSAFSMFAYAAMYIFLARECIFTFHVLIFLFDKLT